MHQTFEITESALPVSDSDPKSKLVLIGRGLDSDRLQSDFVASCRADRVDAASA